MWMTSLLTEMVPKFPRNYRSNIKYQSIYNSSIFILLCSGSIRVVETLAPDLPGFNSSPSQLYQLVAFLLFLTTVLLRKDSRQVTTLGGWFLRLTPPLNRKVLLLTLPLDLAVRRVYNTFCILLKRVQPLLNLKIFFSQKPSYLIKKVKLSYYDTYLNT